MDAGADAGEPVDFGPFDCNPLTNVPCADSDERCAFINDDEPHTACIAEGTVAEGEVCSVDAEGVDDCELGAICIDTCKEICELEPGSCGADDYCVGYAGIFEHDAMTLAGACVLGCDPVTQATNDDGTCGSNRACFLSTNYYPHATCGPLQANPAGQDELIVGTTFDNSCEAGFVPIGDGAGGVICSALCTPAVTYDGNEANIGGVGPNTCAARGATTHECRFAWLMRGGLTIDPLLNQVGICVDPSNYLYDSNGDFTDDTEWPSCADLPDTDTGDEDLVPQNEQWGCAPLVNL
jgi:hypothetical protein